MEELLGDSGPCYHPAEKQSEIKCFNTNIHAGHLEQTAELLLKKKLQLLLGNVLFVSWRPNKLRPSLHGAVLTEVTH